MYNMYCNFTKKMLDCINLIVNVFLFTAGKLLIKTIENISVCVSYFPV